MAAFTFSGNYVGAVNSANDDGSGGVNLELDPAADLDGNGNPYYGATDEIVITVADEDIDANGEFQAAGADGEVTVTSITVNGVEILSGTDKIKFSGSGTDTFEGDSYFYVEGVKLFFLSPLYPNSFADAVDVSGTPTLNVTPRVRDLDIDRDGTIDTGTVEEGNGVFNIFSAESVVIHDLTDGTDDGIITGTTYTETIYGGPSDFIADGGAVINDTINAGGGDDTVFAGDGADSVLGGDGNDSLDGGAGNDTLEGGAGSNTLVGGEGDDLFISPGTDTDIQTYEDFVAGLDTSTYLRFEETSGTTAADTVGTNDGTYLPNTNPNVTGVDGTDSAVDLSGNNGSNGNGYVLVNHDPSMSLAEGTFQLWINPDDVSGTSYIFDMYDGNGAQEGLRLYVQNGVLYTSITDNYSTQTINTGVSVVNADEWQHVAVSFGDGSLTLYHNGVEVASVASTLDLTGNTEDLWIGARQDGSYNENHFDGQVDEFAIHDRALTPDEIADLYSSGPTGGSGGPSADVYDGGIGIDEIDYSASDAAVNVDLVSGTGTGGAAEGDTYTDIENVTGSAFNDTITGDAADNLLDGGSGNDSLSGGAGDDTLLGGDGNDTLVAGNNTGAGDSLVGGAGDDVLTDSFWNATLEGGDGADLINVGYGTATVTGGEGGTDNDTLSFADANDAATVTFDGTEQGTYTDNDGDSGTFSQIEAVEGSAGADSINATADSGGVTLTGLGGDDTLLGGAGNDSIDGGDGADTLSGGDGTDTLVGGADDDTFQIDGIDASDTVEGGETATTGSDFDTLDFSTAPTGISVTYTGDEAGTATDGIDTLSFSGIERLILTDQNDTLDLFADNASTTADLGAGDDSVTNAKSSDSIEGGEGSDTITGQANDGAGVSTLSGGAGGDSIDGADRSDLIYGGTGNDTLEAGEENSIGDDDTLYGGDGDDLLTSIETDSRSNDQLFGEAGNDTITVAGGDANLLSGGVGNDSLTSASGNDTLQGGDGADTIEGGAGNDSIDAGGADGDVDVIRFSDGDGNDTVSGFEGPIDNGDGTFTGRDQLDLSGLTDAGGQQVNTRDVTVGDDGFGNALLSFPNGESITLVGIAPSEVSDEDAQAAMGIPAPDDVVEGTAGADTIDVNYTGDPEGDAVDGNDNAAGNNDDVIVAGDGDDSVLAGDGNDSVDGGLGNDTIYGGSGDDTLDGGEGDDVFLAYTSDNDNTFLGGTGNDTILAMVDNANVGIDGNFDASNSIEAIDGNGFANVSIYSVDALAAYLDFSSTTLIDIAGIYGESNNDTIIGSTGADNVFGGTGSDSLDGNDGDDTLFGQDGDDTLLGGDGNDSLDGDDAVAGNDSIDGGAGNDTLIGDGGNDTLIGGSGDDDIFASSGDNLIDGGTGADEVFAGSGNDTITVDQGDTVLGAGGDDTFILQDLDTTGTGNAAINITGGEGGETNGDTLILTPDVAYSDITFTNTDDAAGGLSGNFTMADGTTVTFSEMENIICFTPGAMILTGQGERAVETLQVGDLVVTRDQGLRPIRWIGKRTVQGHGRFAPIRVGANALDNARTGLLVSPQHRILYTGYRAELLFGDSEVLVPAKHLADGKDVVQEPCDEVTYIHLMFDHHEVIYADGIATESFHAGDMGLTAIHDDAREELFSIFPELRTAPGQHLETARTCLKNHEAALLKQYDDGYARL